MFIGRRPDGSIYAAWTVRQPSDADHPGQEELADDHPDVVAFVNRPRRVNSAEALVARQREEALSALDAAIEALPAAQRSAFRLIQQLLKD